MIEYKYNILQMRGIAGSDATKILRNGIFNLQNQIVTICESLIIRTDTQILQIRKPIQFLLLSSWISLNQSSTYIYTYMFAVGNFDALPQVNDFHIERGQFVFLC